MLFNPYQPDLRCGTKLSFLLVLQASADVEVIYFTHINSNATPKHTENFITSNKTM